VFGLEFGARLHHLQCRADRDADRIDVCPRAGSGDSADVPLLFVDLAQIDQPALGEVEQRRGEAVLRDGLGADVLGLHRPEARRRRVLKRESGRRFDCGAVPQKRAEPECRRQPGDPHHARHRLTKDAVPGIGPRQADPRRCRHVDAGAHRHGGTRREVCRRQSDRVALDGQVAARATDAVANRALCAADISRQGHRDFSVVDRVVPGRGDNVPEEHRRRGRGCTHNGREGLTGAGGTRVKNTRDAVADLEDVGAPTEVLVRITDLGDPEAFAVLPQHLVRGRPAVEQY